MQQYLRTFGVLVTLVGLVSLTASAQQYPATEKFKNLQTFKDEVVAARGVVATNHPLASAAGQMMLAKGGNAIDAIIAAYFALSVVEPAMVSPFGSGFITLYTEDGEAITLDNYTVAPAAATPTMYELVHLGDEQAQAEAGHTVVGQENTRGVKSIGVAGNLKAWLWALKYHGSRRLDLQQIMAPAIDYAKNGHRLSPAVARTINRFAASISLTSIENSVVLSDRGEALRSRGEPQYEGWAEQFAPGGEPLQAGAWIKRSGYAVTLEAIANAAPAGASFDKQLDAAGRRFYAGDIAEYVASYVRSQGGILSMSDLVWYWGEGLDDMSEDQGLRLRTPIRGNYRGYEVIAMPPTSSGGTHIVEILNILEGYDIGALGFGNPKTLHLMTEAMKIAWADRDAYMGDPDYAHRDPSYDYAAPPVERLIDKAYASNRRAEIDENAANRYAPGQFEGIPSVASLGLPTYESANTTHATAMDSNGNVVSMTQTLNHGFGSGVAVPGMKPGSGMLLNNTMALFDPDPRPGYERANAVASRKRQLSSMSPTIILKDGKPYFAIGTPGGTRIYAAVLQGIMNVIDHGMTIQQAVEAPRIWTMMYGDLNIEEGIPQGVGEALEAMGHSVRRVRTVAGGMNGVLMDPATGLIHGGACWRADGSAAGWSGGDALPPDKKYPPSWESR